jgi:hypothetical protein
MRARIPLSITKPATIARFLTLAIFQLRISFPSQLIDFTLFHLSTVRNPLISPFFTFKFQNLQATYGADFSLCVQEVCKKHTRRLNSAPRSHQVDPRFESHPILGARRVIFLTELGRPNNSRGHRSPMLSRKRRAPLRSAMPWLAAWLLLLFCFCAEASGAPFHFIHLTDPHLFDAGDRAAENEHAFRWSVEEINQRVDAGAQFSFVAVTGDLGIEKLVPAGTNSSASVMVPAAQRLGRMLAGSKVPLWFFVPGNNDLLREDPKTITHYFAFIQALQKETPEITIIDLTPRAALPGSGRYDFVFGTNRWRIAGFDNASFKGNDSFTDAVSFSTNQLASVALVRTNLAADPPFQHALIFYHIPEIEDPHYASLPAADTNLVARELKRGAFAKEFPLSAWTVTNTVRNAWNDIITNSYVRGLFAGHFHSPVRSVYDSFSWLHDPSKSTNSLGKLVIAPPLAIKRQEGARPAARGFREVAYDSTSGSLLFAKIVWLQGSAGRAAAEAGGVSVAQSLFLIALGVMFIVVGASMTKIIELLEPATTQTTQASQPAAASGKSDDARKGKVLSLGNPAIQQWVLDIVRWGCVVLGIVLIVLGMLPWFAIPGMAPINGWDLLIKFLVGITILLVVFTVLFVILSWVFGVQLGLSSFRPEVVMNITFLSFFSLGVVAIAVFADDWRGFGAGALWAMGALAVGAFFGLLFGIHRTGPNNKDAPGATPDQYRPQINNNLIEVSDWLTKIIVGVGLVELRNFDNYLFALAEKLAACLGERCGLAVAAGIIIAFSFGGFLAGFLNSRTFLTEILRRYDELLFNRFGTKDEVKISVLEDAPIVLGEGEIRFDPLAKEAADYILTFRLDELHNWREIRLWAKAALSQNKIKEAIAGYQRALALVPRDAESRLGYAVALHQEKVEPGVILTQLEAARDSLMRSSPDDLRKNVYKSLTFRYLYLKQPESFKNALKVAREYLSGERPIMSGALWVNIACAYGQAYEWLKSDEKAGANPNAIGSESKVPGTDIKEVPDLRLSKQEPEQPKPEERKKLLEWISEKALYAVRQALRREKKWSERLRHLAGLDQPEGYDSDLKVLRESDPVFAREFDELTEPEVKSEAAVGEPATGQPAADQTEEGQPGEGPTETGPRQREAGQPEEGI